MQVKISNEITIYEPTEELSQWCKKLYTVYRHIFPNGKSYIGITCVNPYHRRWRNGYGYRGQPKMYNAIVKYGWENVTHEILFSNLPLDEANRAEQAMISKFNSVENGYNISTGGGGTYGIPCSEETKFKIGNANRGKTCVDKQRLAIYTAKHGVWNKGKALTGEHYRKIAEERRARCNKPISAYNPATMEKVLSFESCVSAAEKLGVLKGEISRCAVGKRKTSHGFVWRYDDEII